METIGSSNLDQRVGRKTTKVFLSRENDSLRRRAAAWEAVGALPSRLAHGQAFDQILNELVREASSALGATSMAILLLDETGTAMRVAASIGVDGPSLEAVPVEQGRPLEECFRARLPQWMLPSEVGGGEAGDRLLVLPLLYRETPLGVLALARTEPFVDDEKHVALCLAHQVALVAFLEGPARLLINCERVERDLHFVHALKSRLLPNAAPESEAVEIGLRTLRCLDGGGDFHDFVPLPDGRLGLVLGKTSGRGLRSALNLAQLVPHMRGLFSAGLGLSQIVERLNRDLIESMQRGQLVNLCLGELDPARRHLRLVQVGSMITLLVRGARFEEVAGVRQTPLGVLLGCSVEEVDLALTGEATVLLATDGLVRCEDDTGRPWSRARLPDLLRPCASSGQGRAMADALVARLTLDGQGLLPDDVSILTLRAR